MKLGDLAKEMAAELVGDPALEITSVATLEEAKPGQVSFFSRIQFADKFAATKASAGFVPPDVTANHVALLRVKDPYPSFLRAVVRLHGYRKHPILGVDAGARVDPTAQIGANTVIYPGVFIGPRVKVGRDCIIYPNVVIYDDTVIGDRVIVHAGTVIGVDGFGYATVDGIHHKMPQISNVIIEDDVEICSNCTIERGALTSTVIGKGTKIDNLVVIAHGCKIGPNCLIVAQVGVAGSTVIGKNVVIGGQAGVIEHVKIGDGAIVAARSSVIGNVDAGTVIMGSPAKPVGFTRRVYAAWWQLPELLKRVRRLEKQSGLSGKIDSAAKIEDNDEA